MKMMTFCWHHHAVLIQDFMDTDLSMDCTDESARENDSYGLDSLGMSCSSDTDESNNTPQHSIMYYLGG